MQRLRVALFCLAFTGMWLVLPLPAIANPMPMVDAVNLHWAFFAELGVVFCEAMLLRWLLRLSLLPALYLSLLANAASFFVGLFISGGFGTVPFLPTWMLLGLSDLYWDPQFRDYNGPLFSFLGGYIFELFWLTVITTLFETPVLFFLLARRDIELDARVKGRVLLVNLISYPLFFTTLLLATLWRSGAWREL